MSENGRVAYATVSYDQTATDLSAKARERLEDATAGLGKAGVAVAMSGEPIDGAATGGFPVGEVIGLVIAMVLLVVVLRNLRAARNALGAAFAGIGLGFGALMWLAAATDVPGLAPTLGGMLGLGAGIDYALLLAARQQEELRAGRSPLDAARTANATAGHSAVTAAGIVLVSISGLLVTGIPFVGRAGVAAGLVVLACAVTCVILLPARFVRAGTKMLPKRERAAAPAPTKPRAPWATKRPVLALLAAGAVTIALAAPAAGLELGQPDDRNLTPDTTQRQAYDRLAEGFGAGVNGPLVVAVSLPDGPRGGVLQQLERKLGADREVASVDAPVLNEARDAAVIVVTPKHGPQEESTRALVDRLRDEAIPATLRDSGATAYVGGRTARYGDEATKIASRIPVFAAAVVGLSLLMLLAAFRSWRISRAVGGVQPRLDRGRLRRRGAGVPDGHRRVAARRRAAARRPVRAAVHVRDPVRALHGLQRVPALPRPRGVGAPRGPQGRDRRRLGQHAEDHHRGGRHHDRRLPRVRDGRGPGDQDDGHRARERDPRGRHAGPAVHGSGGADAARGSAVAGGSPPRPRAQRARSSSVAAVSRIPARATRVAVSPAPAKDSAKA